MILSPQIVIILFPEEPHLIPAIRLLLLSEGLFGLGCIAHG